ncbi:UNVERIFIED_CONTAM: hypothetical protein K2H54_056084 [Gekko kuhli]
MEGPVERNTALRLLQQKWELLENHTCLDGEALERLAELWTTGVVAEMKEQATSLQKKLLIGAVSLGECEEYWDNLNWDSSR